MPARPSTRDSYGRARSRSWPCSVSCTSFFCVFDPAPMRCIYPILYRSELKVAGVLCRPVFEIPPLATWFTTERDHPKSCGYYTTIASAPQHCTRTDCGLDYYSEASKSTISAVHVRMLGPVLPQRPQYLCTRAIFYRLVRIVCEMRRLIR
jgi:hypothetical protein